MFEVLISAAVTLAVCLINGYFQQRAAEKKHEETINMIDYKLEELTALQEEKIKMANNRLENLERSLR